jgi:hypothetical protein
MKRVISNHGDVGLNGFLQVHAVDQPGPGGASSEYSIRVDPTVQTGGTFAWSTIKFQKGSILEVGVNGISNEALLAIVEDRLASFQEGPFACRENALALTKIQEAMMWLQWRTRGRIMRGVEGTSNL